MLDRATAEDLRDRHATLVAGAGPIRACEAAARHGVSEADLVVQAQSAWPAASSAALTSAARRRGGA